MNVSIQQLLFLSKCIPHQYLCLTRAVHALPLINYYHWWWWMLLKVNLAYDKPSQTIRLLFQLSLTQKFARKCLQFKSQACSTKCIYNKLVIFFLANLTSCFQPNNKTFILVVINAKMRKKMFIIQVTSLFKQTNYIPKCIYSKLAIFFLVNLTSYFLFAKNFKIKLHTKKFYILFDILFVQVIFMSVNALHWCLYFSMQTFVLIHWGSFPN